MKKRKNITIDSKETNILEKLKDFLKFSDSDKFARIILIYGNNGAGKSRFANFIKKERKFLVLDSGLTDWYNETDKIFSEYDFHNKKFKEKVNASQEALFKKNSGLKERTNNKVRQGNLNNLKKFLEEKNLGSWESWLEFEQNTKNKNLAVNQFTIYDNLHLYTIFEKYKPFLDSLTTEEKEIIQIYQSFSYESRDYTTDKAKFYNQELSKIRADIAEYISDLINKQNLKLGSLNLLEEKKVPKGDDLEFLFKNDNFSSIEEKYIDSIMWNIVQTEEFASIKKDYEEVSNAKRDSIHFAGEINNKYEITENGYGIKIDLQDKSDGERVASIMEIITQFVDNKEKYIFLDDFF